MSPTYLASNSWTTLSPTLSPTSMYPSQHKGVYTDIQFSLIEHCILMEVKMRHFRTHLYFILNEEITWCLFITVSYFHVWVNYLHKYKFYFKYPTKGLPILRYLIKGLGLKVYFAFIDEIRILPHLKVSYHTKVWQV